MSMNALMMAAALATAATTPDPARLAPTGKWVVNYADAMCVLSHDFGPSESSTSIAFKPAPIGTRATILLITPGLIAKPRVGSASVVIGPSGRTLATQYKQIPMPKDGRSAAEVHLDDDQGPLLADAETIAITMAGSTTAVALPGFKPALHALRSCQDELLTEWGVDPSERSRIAIPSKPTSGHTPADWFGPDAYPAGALQKSGRALALYTVGIDGRVHDCRIIASSGVAEFDEATCTILTKNARLTPALDAAGKPMVSHAVLPMNWTVP